MAHVAQAFQNAINTNTNIKNRFKEYCGDETCEAVSVFWESATNQFRFISNVHEYIRINNGAIAGQTSLFDPGANPRLDLFAINQFIDQFNKRSIAIRTVIFERTA